MVLLLGRGMISRPSKLPESHGSGAVGCQSINF
jgi:hypothetical protein